MTEEALDAVGIRKARRITKISYWVLLEGVEMEASASKARPLARLSLGLAWETDYITTEADYENEKPLVNVEAAFFATWCALNGLLRPTSLAPISSNR
jgi:hypothetical protein